MKKRGLVLAAVLCLWLCACAGAPGEDGEKGMPEGKQEAEISQNAKEDGTHQKESAEASGSLEPSEASEPSEPGSPIEAAMEKLQPNERIYQNADGYVRVVFEDGEYYEFYDYPNEWEDDYFWNCDWAFRKLEGSEQEIEVCTGKNDEGTRVYRTIHATHELFYPMEYYEQGLGIEAAYSYLNISEDNFTLINVDEYDDYCYRINSFSYSRVR